VAVLGEAVADALVRPGAGSGLSLEVYPGGSPANVAVGLARLGTPTRFLGRLSRGVLGSMLRAHLAASGVDLSGCVDADGSACLAITSLDRQGHASYDFYLRDATDWLWTAGELAAVRPDGACCLHTGSLALALPPGGPLVENLLGTVRGEATVSVDPNVRPGLVPPEAYRESMARWAGLADIVRLSEEDLSVVLPETRIEDACDTWHSLGVRLVVVTRGGRGAVGSLDGARVSVPAVEVATVDTVGAGDSFTGGLLHALWRQNLLGGRLPGLTIDELRRAMDFAVRVAAATCAVPGADPPWRAQAADWA
jgi:fructokinase